eukprot:8186203-Alexandrium_andersonii.AAC.1
MVPGQDPNRRLAYEAHRRGAWAFLALACAQLYTEVGRAMSWRWAMDCAQGLGGTWLGWARLQGGQDALARVRAGEL